MIKYILSMNCLAKYFLNPFMNTTYKVFLLRKKNIRVNGNVIIEEKGNILF